MSRRCSLWRRNSAHCRGNCRNLRRFAAGGSESRPLSFRMAHRLARFRAILSFRPPGRKRGRRAARRVLRSVAAPLDPPRLRWSRPFAICRPPSLPTSSSCLVTVQVSRGEVLMRQGDAGDALYLVASGRFAVDVDGRRIAEVGSRLAARRDRLLRRRDPHGHRHGAPRIRSCSSCRRRTSLAFADRHPADAEADCRDARPPPRRYPRRATTSA